MFKSALSVVITIVALAAPAAVQAQLWVRQIGTSGGDRGLGAAPDGSGGVYLTGLTTGGLGGPPAGGADVLLVRYDSTGNLLWVLQDGTSASDYANAAAPDGSGGVYVVGETLGAFTGTSAGGVDMYLAHFSGAGVQSWIRQFGSSGNDFGSGAAPDGSGGVYVAGKTTGDLGGTSAGSVDAYLARYDSAGNRLWIQQFGTDSSDVGSGAAPDGAGGVYVVGYTNGSLGGPIAGFQDVFLARYDSSGTRIWIRQFGSSNGNDNALAAAQDEADGLYVAGFTNASLWGPGLGGTDAFVARYDSDGNQTWIRQFGTSAGDVALAAAPDGVGGIYLIGDTDGSLFGPSAGLRDVFLTRFNSAGDQIWIHQLGSGSNDWGHAAAPDAEGGVYAAGWTSGSFGGEDVWLARFGESCYPNCDASTAPPILNVQDFTCFLQRYAAGESYANCDNSTVAPVLNVQDFTCFLQRYAAGCP